MDSYFTSPYFSLFFVFFSRLLKGTDVADGLEEENAEEGSTSGISTVNSNKSLRQQNVSVVMKVLFEFLFFCR